MSGSVDAAPVRRLVERLVGDGPASHVDLEVDPSITPDTFTFRASGGTVQVRAGDLSALGTGFYAYLTDHAGIQVTWSAPTPARVPRPWPDAPSTRVTAWVPVRTYLNVVTAGYSTAYWNWARWEQEIDWMALHGINAPLAVIGHEVVLATAFESLGVPEPAIARWLGGVPYLPWTIMGSTSSWGGPLPQSWRRDRLALARRVLARQRQLGMTPVLPTFGGHVPDELAEALTDGEPRRTDWQGFSTAILEPGTNSFAVVAAAVARAQHDLLGTDHLYAADPLIESEPPTGDLEYLERLGASIWQGIATADPDAAWVMQGWPFHYRRPFWTRERIDAFLRSVPAERLLLLDLWAEHAPVWDDGRGIADRPWAWCAVHNFGGRFSLHGDLHGAVAQWQRAAQSPQGATLRGFGIVPEAIEHNEIYYELLTRLPWAAPGDLDQWIRGFVSRRYDLADVAGEISAKAYEAWSVLAATVYGPGTTRSIPSPVIARPWGEELPYRSQRLAGEALDTVQSAQPPSANIDAENMPHVERDLPALTHAGELLADVVEALGTNTAAAGDLADVVTHVVAQRLRDPIRRAASAARDGDPQTVRACGAAVKRAIAGLDRLAATQQDRLVGSWTSAAKGWSDDSAEAETLAADALRIITVWGDHSSGLHDYSGRHWAGLLADLYLPRWVAWFGFLEDLATARALDVAVDVADRTTRLRSRIVAIEDALISGAHNYPTAAIGDVVSVARDLLATN